MSGCFGIERHVVPKFQDRFGEYKCVKWAAELKSKLADKLVDFDVIQLNGDVDKNNDCSLSTTSWYMVDVWPECYLRSW